MRLLDTEMSPLDAEAEVPAAHKYRRILRDVLVPTVVVLGLTGGGASVGWFLGAQQARADHLAEIARLQFAHEVALRSIGYSMENAASSVSEAADAVKAVKPAKKGSE